ncbi:hypothetical protein OR604_18245 [Aeromonas caviae]|uniref:hypothetical protein n=1 Tax=Aeromonas caviae TaxID=648 RepID=UPI00224D4779|nr:hypothetical protein [Aeromonas caviae]MCX4038127.1 hypothetical protein [Aeromonas caviae]
MSGYRATGPAGAKHELTGSPMAIERQGNQVHQIRIAGDQLASARHRGGDHLQLRDRSPGANPGQQQERTRPSRSRLVLVPWPPALPGGCTTPRATRCTGSALPATSWPAPAIEEAITCGMKIKCHP